MPVRQLIVSLSDLSVCLGAGTSASTQVDLFFFSFVIVKRQNKTSYKTLGTSRKVPLLRTAGLEEGQAEPEATLHSPAFAGACPGVHSPPRMPQASQRHLRAVSKINQTRMGLCWQEALGNLADGMKGWLRIYGNDILLLLSNYKEEENH